MLAGNPERFAILVERIPEWESQDCICGILQIWFRGTVYPQTLCHTTLSTDVYALLSASSVLMQPPLAPELAALPPEAAFLQVQSQPERFQAPLHALADSGYHIFVFSDGQTVLLMLGSLTAENSVALLDTVTLPAEEFYAIRGRLSDCYAQLREQKQSGM